MYSLKCSYFNHNFETIDELLDYVIERGMDPNYEITRNGEETGETAWDLIGPGA